MGLLLLLIIVTIQSSQSEVANLIPNLQINMHLIHMEITLISCMFLPSLSMVSVIFDISLSLW